MGSDFALSSMISNTAANNAGDSSAYATPAVSSFLTSEQQSKEYHRSGIPCKADGLFHRCFRSEYPSRRGDRRPALFFHKGQDDRCFHLPGRLVDVHFACFQVNEIEADGCGKALRVDACEGLFLDGGEGGGEREARARVKGVALPCREARGFPTGMPSM